MKEGIVNENANVSAWLDDDNGQIIIVIETECGGYYERVIDVEDVQNGHDFSFIPEGA